MANEVKQMTEQDRLEAIQFFENKLKSESEDNKFYELALEALRKHSVLMNITDKLEELACDEPNTSKAQGLCLATDTIDEMLVNMFIGCENYEEIKQIVNDDWEKGYQHSETLNRIKEVINNNKN